MAIKNKQDWTSKRQCEPKTRRQPKTRCAPNTVDMVAKVLPQPALDRLKQLGLSNLLNLGGDMNLNSKTCGRLIEKAVVHADLNQIALHQGWSVNVYHKGDNTTCSRLAN